MTRAPANVDPIVCVSAGTGLRPRGPVRFSGSKKERQLSAGPVLLKAKRGPKKAIMAVVASILTAIFHMLKDGTMYHDLGCDHFKRRSTDQQKKAPT
jgi:hypothetical protein